jgi:hypothetical protein
MNPRLLVPRASGLTNPNTIAGLDAWFDTLTASSYTEASGQISEWRSRVGSISVAQSTANNRPTLFESSGNVQGATRSEINGRQAFYFDGTNDILLSTTSLSGTQWTAFAACRPQSVSGQRGVVTRDNFPTRGPQYLRHNDGVTEAIGNGGGFTATAGTLTNNTAVILHAVQAAATLQMFVNNVGGTAVAGTQNSSSTVLMVGTSFLTSANFLWLGSIGEILLYQRALTTGEQLAVYQYLRKRWGI